MTNAAETLATTAPEHPIFRAPEGGGDVHIGLTSGHSAVVTEAGSPLHPRFHKEAVVRGCMPMGATMAYVEPAGTTPSRTKVIEDAMVAMLDGEKEGDFKQDGTPDLNALSHRVGFKVLRTEADNIWPKVKAAHTD